MCARYSLATPPETLADLFEVVVPEEFVPRYNIAPTQEVPVVYEGEEGRKMRMFRWGLVPSWSKDLSIGQRLINARADTAAEKSSFRTALQRRRCLIPATSFFEWREESCPVDEQPTLDLGERPMKRVKQPYLFSMKDGSPFALAGLWEFWRSPADEPVRSFTILTTEPNELVLPFHDRMPCILPHEHWCEWLSKELQAPAKVLPLVLNPFDAEKMKLYAVARSVNNAQNESPDMVQPVGA